MSNIVLAAGGDDGYQISRSVRLRSSASAYFNRTPAVASNRTTWTWSGWVKRGTLGGQQGLFAAYGTGSSFFTFSFDSSTNGLFLYDIQGGTDYGYTTSAVFRDPSAWYHVVLCLDTTQATVGNRVKLYINGVQQTFNQNYGDFPQNYPAVINYTYSHRLGSNQDAGAYLDGYLTEVNFVDGQALTPSSFGETDAVTGVWKPKKYLGTYGTNGFYLPFNTPTTTQLTDSATVTAPFGGTAANAKVSDTVYVTSNTSTGGSFTFIQYDFGVSTFMSRYYIGGLSFTGGVSTFQVQYGDDPTWTTFTTAGSLSVNSGGQNFSGNIGGRGRYLRLTPTAFGTNGQAIVDSVIVYSDNISLDASGNGNSWVPNNISVTAGVTYDAMIDSPTNYPTGTAYGVGNYATMNPVAKGLYNGTLSNGNLTATPPSAQYCHSFSTIAPTSGKWYFEAKINGTVNSGDYVELYGPVAYGNVVTNSNVAGSFSDGYGLQLSNGNKSNNGSNSAYGSSFASGDICMMAVDIDNGKIWWGKNGTWFSSGDPAAGTNAAYTNLVAGTAYLFGDTTYSGGATSHDFTFGQRPFAYTPPTGYKALNTQNLPDATITKGSKNFDVSLYTGTGATQSITGVAFQPDLVWIKKRNTSTNGSHQLVDAVRGTSAYLFSDSTIAEITAADRLTAFNSNGFSLSTAAQVNNNADTYVGWQWKAGGTAVSNTSGSITSQVSANAAAGFSVVTYTGNGTNGATVGHGLGVAPKMVVVNSRSTVTNWIVKHSSLSSNNTLELNSTAAQGSPGSGYIGDLNSSTTITLTNGGSAITNVNGNTTTYVAYCFSEVAGYSKFGSYTGNGSADGPFVYCGFRPKFVLMKRTDTAGFDWILQDTSRSTYNAADSVLNPNSSAAEQNAAGYTLDVLSSGFKLRNSGGQTNASGGTYIFMALAENPFKNSLAR